ncbi:MAG TPA: cytochrome c [Burkholderiales bacterium]|nr:cytochrome c [Burkholderiales bacterium]
MFRTRLLAAVSLGLALGAQAAEPQGARRAELIELVRQDCGSCHGLTLKGGLGPPLLPEALAERDVTLLESVILNGRPGTAMPPWRPFLTEDEARWIAGQLKKGWPE